MEFPKSRLSTHAIERLSDRFRISAERILELLNTGQGKRIGTSSVSHLAHRLIWSPVDEQLLVAIQNVIDGTVLTFLTIEMYRRDYDSNLTERRIQKVLNMMVHAGHAPASLWRPGLPDEYVTVFANSQNTGKPIALGRWKGSVDSLQLSELGKRPEFWAWVASQVSAKGHTLQHILSIEARYTGGDTQGIPYAC